MKTGIRLDAGFFVIRICQLFILKLKLYDEKMGVLSFLDNK